MRHDPVSCSFGPKLAVNGYLKAELDPAGVIVVSSNAELLDPARFQTLARRVAQLPVSSREVPNLMADLIFGFEGVFVWPNGTAFAVGDEDIDRAFNDDGSFRWIRSFRAHADRPFKRLPQRRVLPRLRLIDLTFQIADRALDNTILL